MLFIFPVGWMTLIDLAPRVCVMFCKATVQYNIINNESIHSKLKSHKRGGNDLDIIAILNTHLLPRDDDWSIYEVISYRLIIVSRQKCDQSLLTNAIATIVLVEFARSFWSLEVEREVR